MNFFQDFKTEIKLFLIVVFIAVAVSVGGILLLKGSAAWISRPNSSATRAFTAT
ncbi:MAG: hypothetical protein AAB524_00840 [Patescibacteria group bacterium]